MKTYGDSNGYPQHMFLWRNKKNTSRFGLKKSALSGDMLLHSVIKDIVVTHRIIEIVEYLIRSNYRTYPYKCTVKKFCSLQITASVLFLYFFIKAYVVGTHLNCIDLLMQFK